MTEFLNDIQRLCTNLESDVELVMGSVYGLRQWFVDSPGDLIGHNRYHWTIGESHTATCAKLGHYVSRRCAVSESSVYRLGAYTAALAVLKQIDEIFAEYPTAKFINYWPGFGTIKPDMSHEERRYLADDVVQQISIGGGSPVIDIHVPVGPHEVTSLECTCGFYAYTDRDSLEQNSVVNSKSTSVFGIIRAWGKVTQGTKGFRAQHAEIVALTSELRPSWTWEYERSGVTYSMNRSTTWYPAFEQRVHTPAGFPVHTSLESLVRKYRELSTA